MSLQGMRLHRLVRCLALTAGHVPSGRADGQTEALFAITRAHALAKTGWALAGVQRAHASLAAGGDDQVPFWARQPPTPAFS
ncbi:hypothetical protein [Streptomyces albipurpureus]|uniref:Uncharacterized protein n=1 Tax=Streptomyces albipurpureus TaxID=2897419 RepID=A0ABT0UTV6_9ACTN|nr:hypothetical protein [Streptomyces sp. CWNU-1]MCM2392014.1 hypothetical protein [Streptomyces sp. CWNU-1]